jgi:SAM-dependent methyltransferase
MDFRRNGKTSQELFEKKYHESIFYKERANSQRNQKRINLVLEKRSSGSLLEIGCGKGGFLKLAETNFSVEGIDISSHAINTAKAHFGERVQVSNIEMRPIPSGAYDIVAAFNILEHLRAPEKAVTKIYRSLHDGGLLFGSVPHNRKMVGKFYTLWTNFFDPTHVSTFAPEVWKQIFQHAGFKQVTFFGEIPYGMNHCFYLRGNNWPYFSFNLMFICEK